MCPNFVEAMEDIGVSLKFIKLVRMTMTRKEYSTIRLQSAIKNDLNREWPAPSRRPVLLVT